LEDTKDSREVRGILKFMRNTFINLKEVEYISLDEYIYFYSQIPLSLWSPKKIFYFKNEKWDALGLLGERIHQFNLHSKTLHLYFKDCVAERVGHKELNDYVAEIKPDIVIHAAAYKHVPLVESNISDGILNNVI
jgi:hypothetical protein